MNNHLALKYLFFWFIGASIIIVASCKEPGITDDPNDTVTFEVDTLLFDTVFVTFGSTTKNFNVYNPHDRTIEISSIMLTGGDESPYRMNIDGIPGNSATSVQILPKDSLYIFVEVTVDPTSQDLPFIVEDSIRFNVNGNVEHVKLLTYGQNAHFYNGDTLESATWIDDKPHVIFNYIIVDSLQTLDIMEGTRVHLHNNADIFVKGTLNVLGTKDSIVTFSGTRLEPGYQDVPGQWESIYVERGGAANFDFAEIRSSLLGLAVGFDRNLTLDQFTAANIPIVNIRNTEIKYTVGSGLTGLLADIYAENSMFYGGNNPVSFPLGGITVMNNCNILGGERPFSTHQNPSLFLGNFLPTTYGQFNAELFAFFTNCIIYGSLDEELEYVYADSSLFNYEYRNCVIKTDTINDPLMIDCIFNESPQFVNSGFEDFNPTENSNLRDAGTAVMGLDIDFEGKPRTDGTPDIGALEYVP